MKNFVFQLSICLTIFFTFQTIAHAAGVFDQSFGTNGTVTTAVGSNLQGGKIKVQPNGKILILGTVDGGSGQNTVLVRYNANGSLDMTFGNNGIVIQALSPAFEAANDLALQSDGKIIVVGNVFSPATQSVDFAVARFNQNGTLDTTFGTDGLATVNQSSTDIFNSVVVQPDDKIVAVGTTSQNNYDFAAIRFNANGTLDQSFSNGGLFFLDLGLFTNTQEFRAVTLFPNGRILIGGTALSNGGMEVLVLLEPNGTFAQDFGSNGIRQESLGFESPGSNMSLAILPGGRFLSVSRSLIRRYLSNGTNDQTFRAAFATGSSDIVPLGTDLAVRSDGKFIVLNQGLPSARYDTVLYDKNGRDINRVKGLIGYDIAVQPDDKFVIAIAASGSFIIRRYVSISSPGTRIADFDYDEKTDLVVSRLGQTVYVLRSSQNVISYQLNRNSGEGVRIIPEDFYSTNPDQFPLYYWRYSGQNNPAYFEGVTPSGGLNTYQWGSSGDIPVGGDYDGETQRFNNLFRKSTELTIFRPSTGDWWIYNRQTSVVSTFHWGANGDKPVPADYDYDGITDYAIYRPSTGTWWVHRSADDTYFTIQFGNASDIPLAGDYDGDGKADFTVYRASEGNWYQYLTTEGFRVVQFGLSGDFPVPGDYDGDGRHDIAIYRQGVWYLLQSSEGLKVVQWGNATDSAVAVRYDQ